MTPESFLAWKARFDKEMAIKKLKEQEDKLKSLSPKEREEYKKFASRLSGMRVEDFNLVVLNRSRPPAVRAQRLGCIGRFAFGRGRNFSRCQPI